MGEDNLGDAKSFRDLRDRRVGYLIGDCQPTPYGPPLALGLSIVAWSAIIGVVIILLL
jgi:hypothetical protein